MCNRSQIQSITDGITTAYRQTYGAAIIGIYLYGSYARGDNDNESDVDYVAIVEGNRPNLQEKLKEVRKTAFELSYINDVIVSPTVIPYDEYLKYRDTMAFFKNIEKDGIRIE